MKCFNRFPCSCLHKPREADTNHNKSCPVVPLTIGTSSGVCIFSVFQSLLLTAKVTSVKIDKSKVIRFMESARKNANHAVPNKKVRTLNRQKI